MTGRHKIAALALIAGSALTVLGAPAQPQAPAAASVTGIGVSAGVGVPVLPATGEPYCC